MVDDTGDHQKKGDDVQQNVSEGYQKLYADHATVVPLTTQTLSHQVMAASPLGHMSPYRAETRKHSPTMPFVLIVYGKIGPKLPPISVSRFNACQMASPGQMRHFARRSARRFAVASIAP
mmetsp:Transcript_52656/g.171194  ORF Transcript_52656/g.171194 Transcript_52656/m.171194 type:complete len:120 (+) Transcript_52656:350-709(+)